MKKENLKSRMVSLFLSQHEGGIAMNERFFFKSRARESTARYFRRSVGRSVGRSVSWSERLLKHGLFVLLSGILCHSQVCLCPVSSFFVELPLLNCPRLVALLDMFL